MDYNELKKQTNVGWNTWNSRSVMSHVYLPYGFAINLCLKDYSTDRILREPLVGRSEKNEEHIFPGIRSWDGRYTTFDMEYCTTKVRVESTVWNDEQIILITPISCTGVKTPTLIVEACLFWGKEGTVSKKNGRIYGDFEDGKQIEIFTSATTYNMPYAISLSPAYAVDLSEPVVVSTVPCTVEKAQELLRTAKSDLVRYAEQFGDNAESYTAMKSCMAWDTIYECEHDRICSPVSRTWNCSWGGYVLFEWDTYFAALMASIDNKELAYLNAIAITDEATERGFIPNFGSTHDFKSRDRTEPPVGAMVTLELYRKYQETWFVEKVYPTLLRWNKWFSENRMTPEGYLCWGSNRYSAKVGKNLENQYTSDRQGAAYESGLDNSPMYDDCVFDEKQELLLLADVGLMGLYIKECASLIELAKAIGREDDIEGLQQRRDRVEQALMTLWSEEDGIFENKDLVTGQLSKRISPTSFYSLYSDKVTAAQKESMMKRYFYNPEEFWGDYIMPSISRRDPAYHDQCYWRGRIWAPMNFLVYWALKDAGLYDDALVLAGKSRELLLKEWRAHGHVHENYSGDDGWGCGVNDSDKFYHWGGLLAYIAIDAEKNLKK